MSKFLRFCDSGFAVKLPNNREFDINEDGSGSIQMTEIRHEPSYMQLVGEQYGKEDFIRIVRMYLGIHNVHL
jgi:hypothetical protein